MNDFAASDMDEFRKRAVELGYNPHVESLRDAEYPQLKDVTYLDHAGTTLYATSLIHTFSADLTTHLYGNPHSPSPSSQATTKRIDDVRLAVLRLFNADPTHFDVVFCANATAGIKLVLEGFMAQLDGFKYRYHSDAHTSLVGVRGLTTESTCVHSDAEVELWLRSPADDDVPGLFAWPAQSNFSGRRLPVDWAGRVRGFQAGWYTLLDAAALVTTTPLNLGDVDAAPDFTVVSFYKMFGFPDLGALIVRRESAGILGQRRYFGGGTVDAVTVGSGGWSARKETLHEGLEDGTLPFHSILALDAAIGAHERLYGGFTNISRHAFSLVVVLHGILRDLKHGNGRKLCRIYTSNNSSGSSSSSSSSSSNSSSSSDYTSPVTQGPIIALNLQRPDGTWHGYAEVEKLAAVKGIHIRTGGLCNPGGIEAHVGVAPWEVEQNYHAGHRCWDDQDILGGKPTGAIRVSLGAMSTLEDVLKFVAFLKEFYLDDTPPPIIMTFPKAQDERRMIVESVTVYPIKSCGGFRIAPGVAWQLRPEGLAWDREWCLVHLGTGAAIDQKRYPRMALIRPVVDLAAGVLRVTVHNSKGAPAPIQIPLHCTPTELQRSASRVCGDRFTALTYNESEVIDFFTEAVRVPCTLARFPAGGSGRHAKAHLNTDSSRNGAPVPIGLSNESPFLVINGASVDALNALIAESGGKRARPEVYRANIVLRGEGVSAYAEDEWRGLRVGGKGSGEVFEVLGACRRCHMVCVDQETAEKDQEPYTSLAKSRRIGGRVVFGVHARWRGGVGVGVGGDGGGDGVEGGTVRVGMGVDVW